MLSPWPGLPTSPALRRRALVRSPPCPTATKQATTSAAFAAPPTRRPRPLTGGKAFAWLPAAGPPVAALAASPPNVAWPTLTSAVLLWLVADRLLGRRALFELWRQVREGKGTTPEPEVEDARECCWLCSSEW